MRKLTKIILMGAILPASLTAQPMYSGGNRPVMLTAMDDLDACSWGRITDQGPEGAVLVFPGDSTELEATDYLSGGQEIWACDASEDNNMIGIVYSQDGSVDCEVSSPVTEDRPYLGPCDWGWVVADGVEVVAG